MFFQILSFHVEVQLTSINWTLKKWILEIQDFLSDFNSLILHRVLKSLEHSEEQNY